MTVVPDKPSRRFRRFRLLLLLATTAVVSLIAIWFMTSFPSKGGDSRSASASVAGTSGGVLPPGTIADENLLWRNEPGISETLPLVPSRGEPRATWSFRIDRNGFRGEDRHAAAGETRFRILCVGDSVTFGAKVEQGREYPAVLAELLGARYPRHHFEVVNAGVPGWSWVQGTEFLLQEGFALHPDVVVAAHGVADASHASITDSERMWLNHHLANRCRGFEWLCPTTDTTPAQSPGCRLQETSSRVCQRVSPAEISVSVRRMGAAAKAAGVEFLLLNLDFGGTASMDAVREVAIREDFRFVNIAHAIRSDRLDLEVTRSRTRKLALPRVPLVPAGRIGMPAPDGRGPRMRFRVTDAPSQKPVYVRGSDTEHEGFHFDVEMRDDGTAGDERAGDGVYSAFVTAPASLDAVSYVFVSGQTPEFDVPAGLDGDHHAERIIRFNRDGDAPIELFGRRHLMRDTVHPDSDGHLRIAEDVLREVEKLPSFRRYVGTPSASVNEPEPGSQAQASRN